MATTTTPLPRGADIIPSPPLPHSPLATSCTRTQVTQHYPGLDLHHRIGDLADPSGWSLQATDSLRRICRPGWA
jgi:hypothetical protein